MRDRANMEKNCKMTQGLIVESNTKLDELARALNEADSTKKKLQVEAQDLNLKLLLCGVSFIQGSGKLIKLGVAFNNETLSHLAILLHVGTVSHSFIQASTSIHKIPLHASLVLFRLGFVLVDVVNVLSHFRHGVVML